MAKITDEESALAWLEGQPHQVQMWFAARTALRALALTPTFPPKCFDVVALAIFRTSVTIASAATCAEELQPEVHRKVVAARSTLQRAADAHGAVLSENAGHVNLDVGFISRALFPAFDAAADGVSSGFDHKHLYGQFLTAWGEASHGGHGPGAAVQRMLSVTLSDCQNALTWPALWAGTKVKNDAEKYWASVRAKLQKAPEKWAFWLKWYEAILEGRPLPWDLSFAIATELTEADWEAGPEHVQGRIKEIEQEFLQRQLPVAETVEFNDETQKFHAVPIPIENAGFISTLMQRTADAVDDVLGAKNGLREESHEVRKLRRTHARYGNDPQRMEMDYTSVATSLRRQIRETGELPDSEDNLALLEALEEGALGLRAHHPKIAANRETLARQKFRNLKPEHIALLEESLPVLVGISEGQMAEDFANDIPRLINDAITPLPSGAPPLPGADETTRIFSRVSKMQAHFDRFTEKMARAFDSNTFKTARLGFTISGMFAALIGLATWLLSVI